LIVGDWSLKVGDGKYNHQMTLELKGHKTVRGLNPNDSSHLHDLMNFLVLWRRILTNLKNKNGQSTTTIKHIYNTCHKYMQSIRVWDQKYNIWWNPWLRISMCIIIGIMHILIVETDSNLYATSFLSIWNMLKLQFWVRWRRKLWGFGSTNSFIWGMQLQINLNLLIIGWKSIWIIVWVI